MDHQQIARLLEIMKTLRSPGGCPWDARQTPQTLRPYLLEETYEALEALDEGRPDTIREELGDLLLQVVFLARIFEEAGDFDFEDVAGGIADKLVRRHPHVFADLDEDDTEALHRSWDRIKASEKADQPRRALISPPPKALPSLQRAQKLLTKMARYDLSPLLSDEPPKTSEDDAAERRVGETLLGIVDEARRQGIDAEGALRRCTDRLARSTASFEESLHEAGTSLADASPQRRREMWRRMRDEK